MRKLLEKSFSQIVLVDHALLTTPPKIYSQTPIIMVHSPKTKKNSLDFAKKTHENLNLDTKNAVLTPLHTFFCQSQKKLSRKIRQGRNTTFFKKKTFHWNSPLYRPNDVTITLPKVLLKSRKSFCSIRKKNGKKSNFFLQSDRLKSWRDVSTIRAQLFWRKSRNISLNMWKRFKKTQKILKERFFKEDFLNT